MKSKIGYENLEHIIDSYQKQITGLNSNKLSKVLSKLKAVPLGFALAGYTADKALAKSKIDADDIVEFIADTIEFESDIIKKYITEVKECITEYMAKASKVISTFIHNCPDTVKYVAAGVGITVALAAFYYYYKRRKKKENYL